MPTAHQGDAPAAVPAPGGGLADAPGSGESVADVPASGEAAAAGSAAVSGDAPAPMPAPGEIPAAGSASGEASDAGAAVVSGEVPAVGSVAASGEVPAVGSVAASGEVPAVGSVAASGEAPAAGSVVVSREAPAAASVAASGEVPVGDGSGRAEPLHEPDPYGTPPYGEPGPWAPAPPVQHPAVASATGAVPPGHAAHPATGVPSVTPAAASMPGPAAPGPASALPSASIPGPPAGPWQRYDPWAATPLPAPLLHSGAPARRTRLRRMIIGGALALALVSGGLGGLLGAYIERNGGVGAVQLPQAGKEPAGRAPDSVAGIAARALPSVVTLHVTGSDEQGTGTGFVLDRLGHILTNNHVVENAASGGDISVTFSGGQTAKARIIGRDTGYDLAVVQVSGVRGLTPIPLGNSDNVQVGDPVVAIGAPFDLANTVTSGIISAKERPITAGGQKGDGSDVSYVDALQTDAPINPGNSGGPLLDSKGRVVGINSAIRSADTGSDVQSGQAGSIGLGFAIPVNQARRVAEELINKGKASHPVIGVTLDMNYTGDGAKVGAKGRDGGAPVTPGGPGAHAGIKAGDVITAVDGQRVHSGEELIVKTRAHRPGDRLELTVRRDGKERTVSLVLGSSGGD
ncbi:trypsin-like peptidase domain-containing protein [Streptomyces naganishii]|uniref:trypsin-like peptidase domain-containing protein n=1 Tax=Streptomyces naganishii TaxID=285447 RepID=UPI0036BD0471